MEMPLEKFLETYRGFVKVVVDSLHSNYLDSDDLAELQYDGLWQVWKSYDPNRVGASALKTYITSVIRNHAKDLINKKRKWYNKHISSEMTDIAYYDELNPKHSYTDEEWELISLPYQGYSFVEIQEKLNINSKKYKNIQRYIVEKRK